MESLANNSLDSYLALIPRGFQHVASESISEELLGYKVEIEIVGEAITDESSFVNNVTTALKKQQERSRRKNSDIEPCCCLPVGSVAVVEENLKNLSIGYRDKTNPIISCSGVLAGVVWIKIVTSAPVEVIATHLRVVGPLIALVNIWQDIEMTASQSVNQAVDSIQKIVQSQQYPFSEALNLWHRHVQSAWNLSREALDSIGDKMKGLNAMKYRLSMIRSDSEKYQYTRQEFLTQAVDIVMPAQLQESWKVDLTSYDVEVVLLMHPHALAIGVTLRPYQHLKVKSFALGGIPPDVSPPVLPGEILSKLIRLRPTTAHLLLHVAKIEPGDVVLDPCAGVGTIPVEVMFHKPGAVGFGGDLVLTPEAVGPIASSNEQEAQNLKKTMHPTSAPCSNLMAWDATCLPLRSASIDVVVSDLPFGQQVR